MLTPEEFTIREGNFEFFPLTSFDGEPNMYAMEHNCFQWKGDLTLEEYMDREKLLHDCEICMPGSRNYFDSANAKIIGNWGFALRDLSLKYESGSRETFNIVSSLELLIRESYRVVYSSETEPPTVTKVLSGCVGTVHTLKAHRGKGYAKVLLRLLNKWSEKFLNYDTLSTTGQQLGFNTLYSEIGEYYSNFGYISKHVPFLKIPFGRDLQPTSSTVQLLERGLFKALAAKSHELLKRSHIEATLKDKKTRLFLGFNSDIIEWFHTRSAFLNKVLNKNKDLKYGLQLTSRGEVLGYAVWLYNFNDKLIDILKFEAFSEDKSTVYKHLLIETLIHLQSLDKETLNLFPNGLKLWHSAIPNTVFENPEFQNWLIENLHAQLNIKNTPSLSAILSFNKQDNVGLKNDQTVWENNEKWCWF